MLITVELHYKTGLQPGENRQASTLIERRSMRSPVPILPVFDCDSHVTSYFRRVGVDGGGRAVVRREIIVIVAIELDVGNLGILPGLSQFGEVVDASQTGLQLRRASTASRRRMRLLFPLRSSINARPACRQRAAQAWEEVPHQ